MMDGSDTGGFVQSPRTAEGSRYHPHKSVFDTPAYQAAVNAVDFVVERRPRSWFWKRWQVRPSQAHGEFSAVFKGSRYDCLVVQQQLHCARSNGAFIALSPEYH